MPGGDRTGPGGLGSMTGRGLGYCAGYDMPGYTKGPGMGRAWGRGRGMGYGRGIGYGRDWGRGYVVPIYPQYAPSIIPRINPDNQLNMLKQQKDYLELEMNDIKNAIDDISKRITELEKED
ncbi:MAG: DUF5320 domain-containing protein [Candidatus Thorarchaeota archaeon]